MTFWKFLAAASALSLVAPPIAAEKYASTQTISVERSSSGSDEANDRRGKNRLLFTALGVAGAIAGAIIPISNDDDLPSQPLN